jgi:4-diphosphocytidyl-2-C-methyl-D-erythritol kinase
VRPEEVALLAARLGSDVPSQLIPGLWLGTGGGEFVEPLAPLVSHAFVILPQPVPLATADVYREADRLRLARSSGDLGSLSGILRSELRSGAAVPGHLIVNDLQPAARSLCPQVGSALEAARSAGADQALVSGSGPTVAGVFWGADAPDRAAAACEALSTPFPGASVAVPVGAEFAMPRIA